MYIAMTSRPYGPHEACPECRTLGHCTLEERVIPITVQRGSRSPPSVSWGNNEVRYTPVVVDLGFALTYHKSQSKTLRKVLLDIRSNARPTLTWAGLYVGASRVPAGANLRLLPGLEDQISKLKRLKPSDALASWFARYDANGKWIHAMPTPEKEPSHIPSSSKPAPGLSNKHTSDCRPRVRPKHAKLVPHSANLSVSSGGPSSPSPLRNTTLTSARRPYGQTDPHPCASSSHGEQASSPLPSTLIRPTEWSAWKNRFGYTEVDGGMEDDEGIPLQCFFITTAVHATSLGFASLRSASRARNKLITELGNERWSVLMAGREVAGEDGVRRTWISHLQRRGAEGGEGLLPLVCALLERPVVLLSRHRSYDALDRLVVYTSQTPHGVAVAAGCVDAAGYHFTVQQSRTKYTVPHRSAIVYVHTANPNHYTALECKNRALPEARERSSAYRGLPPPMPRGDTTSVVVVDHVGVPNINNTCYLGALLQSVVRPLMARLLDEGYEGGTNDMFVILRNQYKVLTGATSAGDEFRQEAIHNLRANMGFLDPQFIPEGVQHDPHDVWMTMLDQLPGPVLRRFAYTSVYVQYCPGCEGERSEHREKSTCLSVPPVAGTLDDCIAAYQAPETLESTTAPCRLCGSPRLKSIAHEGEPTFLLVQLVRTTVSGKNRDAVRVPLKLPHGSRTYILVSVTEHLGGQSGSGHYTAYCRIDGAWFFFDDDAPVRALEPDLNSRDVCMVMYRIEDNVATTAPPSALLPAAHESEADELGDVQGNKDESAESDFVARTSRRKPGKRLIATEDSDDDASQQPKRPRPNGGTHARCTIETGHHSHKVAKGAKGNSRASSLDLPRYPLTHPDFNAQQWYDVLVEAKCKQHSLAVAYNVVGIDPQGLIGDKANIVKGQYYRQCIQVHPDKQNFADCEDRMQLLVKAYELVQNELQQRKG